MLTFLSTAGPLLPKDQPSLMSSFVSFSVVNFMLSYIRSTLYEHFCPSQGHVVYHVHIFKHLQTRLTAVI